MCGRFYGESNISRLAQEAIRVAKPTFDVRPLIRAFPFKLHDDTLTIDDDVLFAAAIVHDMGGFEPWAIKGVDHALRSTQVVDSVLEPAGFPMNKSSAVKKAILTHSYYCPDKPETPEALVLHDAETLDFMGDIGATRIFSIVGKETVTPDPAP